MGREEIGIIVAGGWLILSTIGFALFAFNMPLNSQWGDVVELIRKRRRTKAIVGFYMLWGGGICFLLTMTIMAFIRR
jgi:hypothetical protein